MSNTQEYNGWTNWETWNVLLWLDNEENLYKIKQSFIRTNEHKQNFESIVKYEEIAETWQEEYEFENK